MHIVVPKMGYSGHIKRIDNILHMCNNVYCKDMCDYSVDRIERTQSVLMHTKDNIHLKTQRQKLIPHEWELWWAYTLFYDTSDVKMRPVIILESRSDMIPVIEVTSHAPRDWLVWQYPLQDWFKSGLRHPSTAVLGAISTVPKEALGRRIGILSYTDRMNIKCMLDMQASK